MLLKAFKLNVVINILLFSSLDHPLETYVSFSVCFFVVFFSLCLRIEAYFKSLHGTVDIPEYRALVPLLQPCYELWSCSLVLVGMEKLVCSSYCDLEGCPFILMYMFVYVCVCVHVCAFVCVCLWWNLGGMWDEFAGERVSESCIALKFCTILFKVFYYYFYLYDILS